MIKINFEEPNTEEWRYWRNECEKETKEIWKSVRTRDDFKIGDLYKNKFIKKNIYMSKEGPFHGKCAYCESYLTDFQPGTIDHFRPKKAVIDEKDNQVMIKDKDGNDLPHPGYFWLAYAWQNLLPTCAYCNEKAKRDRFPVRGKHAVSPKELCDEQPLLINPIVDNPEEHLAIEISTGLMIHKSNRGEMSIKILELNIREQLLEERFKAILFVKAKLVELKNNSPQKADSMKYLQKIVNGEFAFSLAARTALYQWLKDEFSF